MEITPDNLRALRTQFSGIFREAYGEEPVFYSKLSTSVPSSTSQNDYGWMAKSPKMREWLGPRVVQNISAQTYTLKNRTFEATIGVKREDIEDDNLGIYSPLMAEMGAQVKKQPDDLIIHLLQNGHAEECYDGQFFFDTDHPIGDTVPGTQQNYWASGKALSVDNAMAVRAAMMSFKGEGGRPLGVRGSLLVVPPALEHTALKIAKGEIGLETTTSPANLAAGTSNVAKGLFEVMVIPELAGQDTTWYLLDVTRRVKPFVFQKRRAPAFVSKTNLSDDNVFYQNEFHFGADARNNAGYALWFLAAKAAA